MTPNKELKKQALELLKGNRTKLALAVLMYFAAVLACGILSLIWLGTVLQYILLPPFIVGLHICFLKLIRNKTVKTSDMLDGIGMMRGSIALYFVNSLLLALWSLLLIVPGWIKGYSYALSYHVLIDNPDMTQSEAREESIRLMEGNKMRLFLLDLSFIGWHLLSLLTGGLLYLWVIPYIQTTFALFYDELKQKKPRQGIYVPLEAAEDTANG